MQRLTKYLACLLFHHTNKRIKTLNFITENEIKPQQTKSLFWKYNNSTLEY